MATEQDIRNAERLSNYLTTDGAITKQVFPSQRTSLNSGFTSPVMPIPASPEAEGFNRTGGNFLFNKPTTPAPKPTSNKGGGGTGAGKSEGMTAEQALALAKFNYDKEKDANKLAGLQNYFDSGAFNKTFDDLLGMIDTQNTESKKNITDAYGRSTTNINEGYDVASGLGTEGYRALNQYLTQNQNDPYAGMQATIGSAPDALSSYLSAYGVSDQPVQGQIQADQLQAQQGAGNYQNLINLLSAVAQQGDTSRGAESQMSQLMFDTNLGQERAGYQSQASNAQAQALAALQQQMAERQFGVESNRGTVANQLAQMLAEINGRTTGSGTETETETNESASGRQIDADYASKAAAYNRPAQTNEQIAALRAQQEAARLNEILQAVSGRRGNGY